MARQVLGKVMITSKGEYVSGVSYQILDVVTYNGSSYVAKRNTGSVPTSDDWQLLAQKGDTYVMTDEDFERVVDKISGDATSEFNQNVDKKTIEFNKNAEEKLDEYNQNDGIKINSYNQNAEDKTNEFISTAESRLQEYNENDSVKTSMYNQNAVSKYNAYESNAESKTKDYNDNANEKLDEYNSNATTKTASFNTNASSKTTLYNENASAKIKEYDDHVVDFERRLEEVEESIPTKTSELENDSDFVKSTDYATSSKGGVIKTNINRGTSMANGVLIGSPRTNEQYNSDVDTLIMSKGTLENIKSNYIKDGLVNNTVTLTDQEQLKIEAWLGLDQNYLTYYNHVPYTVNADYVPAHKKYVDTAIKDYVDSLDSNEVEY